jgi:hypothetical protein
VKYAASLGALPSKPFVINNTFIPATQSRAKVELPNQQGYFTKTKETHHLTFGRAWSDSSSTSGASCAAVSVIVKVADLVAAAGPAVFEAARADGGGIVFGARPGVSEGPPPCPSCRAPLSLIADALYSEYSYSGHEVDLRFLSTISGCKDKYYGGEAELSS